MSSTPYRAVMLDMDGVITRTTHLHALSWQQMFDQYLQQHSTEGQPSTGPFQLEADYHTYMDGKPRYDGMRNFLASRHIHLPQGDPSDSPDQVTICGLGNRKNQIFLALLKTRGVDVYADTVEQIHHWRSQGLKTAVVSSSRNCQPILEHTKLLPLFDVKVDGMDAARLGLEGKPAPALFLQAAQALGVKPQQTVVIEDAIAGVRAGRAGNFALVVGVDRQGNQQEDLLNHGAHQVVADLRNIRLEECAAPASELLGSDAPSP